MAVDYGGKFYLHFGGCAEYRSAYILEVVPNTGVPTFWRLCRIRLHFGGCADMRVRVRVCVCVQGAAIQALQSRRCNPGAAIQALQFFIKNFLLLLFFKFFFFYFVACLIKNQKNMVTILTKNSAKIERNGTIYLQSYNVIVCKIENGVIYLDPKFYTYSLTTSKHLTNFLGIDSKDRTKRLKSGQIKFANLN